jgi:hypothetical protein
VSGLRITWKKVDNVDGYIIYRKEGSGKWKKIKTISKSTTLTYIDNAVSNESGTEYSYSIEAYAKNGSEIIYSSRSEKGKTIKRRSQIEVMEPENTEKGVSVTWEKVSVATGYEIYRKSGNDTTWKKIATIQGNSKVSYVDKKANTNGEKYIYTVKAISTTSVDSNPVGKSVYRVKGSSFTSVKNTVSAKLTLKWKKNAKATGYQIQYSTSSKFTDEKTVTVKNAATVSKTISKLTKGKTYYVRIRTYKKVSSKNYYSAWSTSKKVKVSK